MPADPVYLPVHVGAAGKFNPDGTALDLGYIKDDTGENISEKNANYCELTGLYWAWKNLRADYIGLAHYRRYFSAKRKSGDPWSRILTGAELEKILQEAPVLLPKPRNYYIETNYSQYAHAHHAGDLDLTRAILAERYPEYLPAWDRSMKRTVGHRFNMFVMRYDLFCAWCQWLFDVLFTLEQRLDISSYSPYDQRVFGFVSERLLDIWLETNNIAYREQPCLFMEKQNWLVKGSNFLKRKFTAGKK